MRPLKLSLVLLAVIVSTAAAQQTPNPGPVDPREFGLDIPPGELRYAPELRVLTTDDQGEPVVARLHVEVGSQRIVLLPDGQLVARSLAQAPATDRPFQPIDKGVLAQRLLVGPLAGFKSNQTRRYLYLHNTSDEFALATSRILETMFPGVSNYATAQRIPVREPETPLVVIMFRTEDEFQNYQRMPPGVVAYYNVVTNRVVMYEQSKLGELKPELALRQSIATISHEGAHQILHNIGVQQRLSVWPMWLNEGMAEFFAPTTPERRMRWKGAGDVNDLRMHELERYLKGTAANGADGQMVEHTLLAARLTSTGYASAWALTHYLARNQRAAFNRYVNELSRLRPLEGYHRVVEPGIVPDNRAHFTAHFGSDLADMQRRVVLHLQKLDYKDPFADWPHFVATIATPAGNRVVREANVFSNREQALRWQRDRLQLAPEATRSAAQLAVREFVDRPTAERFAAQWLAGR